MLQLVRKSLWMPWRLLFRKMNIAPSSPARMKLCIFLTLAYRDLWNDFYIVTWDGLRVSGADVGSASPTCAICAIAMIARDAFTHDLAVYISVLDFKSALERYLGYWRAWWRRRKSGWHERGRICANVARSCTAGISYSVARYSSSRGTNLLDRGSRCPLICVLRTS